MLVAPQHRAGAPRYGRLGLSRARPASPDRVVGITNVPSAGIGPEVEIAELRLIHPVEAIRVSNDAGEIQGESPCLQIYEFRRRERSLIHRRAERALTWGHICSRERPIPASRIIGCLVESPETQRLPQDLLFLGTAESGADPTPKRFLIAGDLPIFLTQTFAAIGCPSA